VPNFAFPFLITTKTILDKTILDEDISDTANIKRSKLKPDDWLYFNSGANAEFRDENNTNKMDVGCSNNISGYAGGYLYTQSGDIILMPADNIKCYGRSIEDINLVDGVDISTHTHSGGINDAPKIPDTSLDFQPVEKIFDYHINGATNSVSITGLDLYKQRMIKIACFALNTGTTDQYLFLAFNDDTTSTHYYAQELKVEGTTITSGYANNNTIMTIKACYNAHFKCTIIQGYGGDTIAFFHCSYGSAGAYCYMLLKNMQWAGVGTITKVTIYSGANTINDVQAWCGAV
jgi:hypothetical protein